MSGAAHEQIVWIPPEALEPGDVLLSRGMSQIADLIAHLDGNADGESHYCHAALAVGGESLGVIECVDVGFRERSLYDSIAGDDPRAYVDVYRFRQGLSPAPLAQRLEILSQARKHAGEYAFGSLLLAAQVAQYRRRQGRGAEVPHLQATVLAEQLERVLNDRRGMTCSGLVAQAYCDAGLPLTWPDSEAPPLARVRPGHPATLGPREPEQDPNRGGPDELTLQAGHSLNANLVTPRDLGNCDQLAPVGSLDLSQLLSPRELEYRKAYVRDRRPPVLLYLGAEDDAELAALRRGLGASEPTPQLRIEVAADLDLPTLLPETTQSTTQVTPEDSAEVSANFVHVSRNFAVARDQAIRSRRSTALEALCRAQSPNLIVHTGATSPAEAEALVRHTSALVAVSADSQAAVLHDWVRRFYQAFATGKTASQAQQMAQPSDAPPVPVQTFTNDARPGPVRIPTPIGQRVSADPVKLASLFYDLRHEALALLQAEGGPLDALKGLLAGLGRSASAEALASATRWLQRTAAYRWRWVLLPAFAIALVLLVAIGSGLGTGLLAVLQPQLLGNTAPPPTARAAAALTSTQASDAGRDTPPPATRMVLIPGGHLQSSVDAAEARAAHDHCRDHYGRFADLQCGTDFAGSYFERAALEGPIDAHVPTFLLDVHEASAAQVAGFLNHLGDQVRIVADPLELEALGLDRPVAVHRNAWLAVVNLGNDRAHDAAMLRYQAGRFSATAGHARHPAQLVSWALADGFCRARGARLPTRLEWLWAARGNGRPRPWGDDEPTCEGIAYGRHPQLACAEMLPATTLAVTQGTDYTPDGVYHLGGNVREWLLGARRPWDPDWHAVAGGHYAATPVELDPRWPLEAHADAINLEIGFRCAQDVPAPGAIEREGAKL